MINEMYMTVKTELPDMEDEYSSDTYFVEVEVSEDDIRHYIDECLYAEEVLDYAKQIAPEEFKDNEADLDHAYEILIDEFDEHDDIEDIRKLHQYIEDSVQGDFQEEAKDLVYKGYGEKW